MPRRLRYAAVPSPWAPWCCVFAPQACGQCSLRPVLGSKSLSSSHSWQHMHGSERWAEVVANKRVEPGSGLRATAGGRPSLPARPVRPEGREWPRAAGVPCALAISAPCSPLGLSSASSPALVSPAPLCPSTARRISTEGSASRRPARHEAARTAPRAITRGAPRPPVMPSFAAHTARAL